MSHLPDPHLKTWKAREALAAADLNANFVALLGLIEIAMHAALSPDPATVGLEVRQAEQGRRLAALENLTAMHARQRNEREYTPLAYTAAVMQQVRDLREPTEARCQELLAAQRAAEAMHHDQHLRLAHLEQRPEAATAEEHAALKAAHIALAEKAHVALTQAIALRAELTHVRRIAEGHDRIANRTEFAPLATVAHLLQRIMVLEQRLERESAP